MQDDGNLVLYPVDSLDLPLDAYWSSDTQAAPSIIYRATLGYDGVFRLYSHNFDGATEYNKSLTWYEPREQCDVKGSCGLNSYCNMIIDGQPDCLCLPGTAYVDPNRRFQGCERNYKDGSCKDTNEMAISLYNIVVMDQITWVDDAYNNIIDDRRKVAESPVWRIVTVLGRCTNQGLATKQKYPVKYARRRTWQDQSSKAFFKSNFEKQQPFQCHRNGEDKQEGSGTNSCYESSLHHMVFSGPINLWPFSSLSRESLRVECRWKVEILAWPVSSL
ncbi:hypothetical protein OIU77_002853 [Salix suchowensis]|uniref:Bulb-type lectin domain-containing protein n=1 Tax=Salix suchowensis TaxID=1278906 RepID=A0ABQ9AZW9_9ROSI|nr:hypothetical protein OIU77_002853 [Salix suchowensis]